jgi:sulfate adenylyltransferase
LNFIARTTLVGHQPTPHGGKLVDRFVTDEERSQLLSELARAPSVTLDSRELSDLELIATGAASPLEGFLGSADYRSVLERMRLADGTIWPLPLTLAIDGEQAHRLTPGRLIALRDRTGRLWGGMHVRELYERDPLVEARAVYRTDDLSHPGVAYLRDRPTLLAAGPIKVVPLPDSLPFAHYRLTPRELRRAIETHGWKRVGGFQTRNPIHRAHEHLTKVALEFVDGLVIHPLVGETTEDDVPAAVRFECYETVVNRYYPKERVLLAAFPAAMRYAGPREALFHALVRKNYGIQHLIVGRDHAGVKNFYAPFEAQRIFDQFSREELGVEPLRFDAMFFCRACDNLASARSCPHPPGQRIELSGTRVRELLRSGEQLPFEFTRPEVAEILRKHYRGPQPVGTSPVPARRRGYIVWFTGLSAAGKSTLATQLSKRLEPGGAVQILDGDEIRRNLSNELGFSKVDRDTHIRRLGYIATLLARNGVICICAAISPYADVRNEIHQAAEQQGIPFLEIYLRADLQSLIARDPKGLYKKALAGEIKAFTGISDPYEPPAHPSLEIPTDCESVTESTQRIVQLLRNRGLIL